VVNDKSDTLIFVPNANIRGHWVRSVNKKTRILGSNFTYSGIFPKNVFGFDASSYYFSRHRPLTASSGLFPRPPSSQTSQYGDKNSNSIFGEQKRSPKTGNSKSRYFSVFYRVQCFLQPSTMITAAVDRMN
jgi:hypothetical protein